MTREEELALIEASKKEPGAFRPLYQKYSGQILGYVAKKIGNTALAEEITSDVFFKALTKINLFRPSGHSISPWLYKIALNEIRMHFRKTKKENFLFDRNTLVEPLHLFEVPGDHEVLERLEKILLKQKEKDLTLLELRFYQGLKFEEVGQVLGMTHENAKKKTYRLLEKLRTELMEKV
ncbi:RNA polymerase sigma factor [Marinoscillum sp.]|uniref:RNA polymerase sigma factor n=1 Tax=Marinoscillum sp. TaxID=2024838 RepID=UPI003BAC3EAA